LFDGKLFEELLLWKQEGFFFAVSLLHFFVNGRRESLPVPFLFPLPKRKGKRKGKGKARQKQSKLSFLK